MFANKRIRFFSEREGLTLNTGKILEKKLQKAQYLPEEKGEQFAAKVWNVFKSINTGLERPEGYYHMAGGTYMPLSMLLAPMEPPFLREDVRAFSASISDRWGPEAVPAFSRSG